jgi:Uncharacterized protein conserved in bacteria
MSAGTPEKKAIRLNIFNQTYSLLVTGDPAEMEAAATEVDELMNAIAKAGNVDSTRIAVLACLHLQDRLRMLEHELDQLKTGVADRTQRLSQLLDQIVPNDDTP